MWATRVSEQRACVPAILLTGLKRRRAMTSTALPVLGVLLIKESPAFLSEASGVACQALIKKHLFQKTNMPSLLLLCRTPT